MKNNASAYLQHHAIKHLLREGLGKDQILRLRVSSQSMVPLLNPGDSVLVKQVDSSFIRLGDLVVLRQEQEPVIHRVITIKENQEIHTKGDNLPVRDPPLPIVDVLGRVITMESGNHTIDLTCAKWVRVNRILAVISKLESMSIQSITLGWTTLTRRKSKLGQSDLQPGRKVKEGFMTRGKGISLVRLPFRSLIHFVIRLAQNGFLMD
jgi:signal peptidase I